jgi:hypothetical protein
MKPALEKSGMAGSEKVVVIEAAGAVVADRS